MRINHMTPDDWAHLDAGPIQRVIRKIVLRPGRRMYRYRAYGHQPRVPESGGFLLAPGPHGAFMDPLIFGLGQPRTRLRFMAKFQALEWFAVGRVIRWAGGFPVHRGEGKSAAALEVAERVLESGDGVVVFMEGRMVLEHDGLSEPRSGVARLALKTGVPVVPAAAYGAKRARAYGKHWWFHWPKVTAVWGAPIQFEQTETPTDIQIAQAKAEIWAEVTRLFGIARLIHHYPGGRPKHDTPLADLDTRSL